MNAGSTATLIGVLVGLLLHASIAIFYYGRMSERVSSHAAWLRALETKVDAHETRISRLEGGKANG